MIYLKSKQDIALIKEAARIWKLVRSFLIENSRPGISLNWLDQKADDLIQENQASASFYQCYGFPKHICISVNDQLIHGVPNDYQLQPNDLVTYDVGVTYKNHVCDSAFSVIVSPSNNKLANAINDATKKALQNAIKLIKPGVYTGDLSNMIELTAKKHGYEVIKDFGGHGCGNHVHEDPIILCYGKKNTGIQLQPNMVICLEPMLMTESDQYYIDPTNNWTVVSQNHKLTCHHEHMILVTENGYEILTE